MSQIRNPVMVTVRRSVWGPASVKPSQLVAVIERLMALDAQETCLDHGAWIFCPLLTNKIIKCSSVLRTSKTIHANNKKLHEFTCTFNTLYTAKLDSPSTMLSKHVRLYAGWRAVLARVPLQTDCLYTFYAFDVLSRSSLGRGKRVYWY